MLGAILGDIVGSPYEFDHNNYKHKDFPLLSEKSHFTDDTVMTAAVAVGLIDGKGLPERTFCAVQHEMRFWGREYPHAGYGGMFRRWLHAENPNPYGSFGNGSAMRVSAAGWLFDTLDKTLEMAKVTAEVTHNGELTESVTLDTALRFYTNSGSEVKFEYTTKEEESVEVTLQVYKMATLPVEVSFVNAPRDFDSSVLTYSLSKQTLNVAGPASRIDKLSTLSVGTIDLSTFSLNKVYEMPIELPSDIRLLDNITSITVSFDSSKLETKTMNLPSECVQVVNLPSTYTLTVETERLMNVTLCGPAGALEALTPEQVVIEIDADDFSVAIGQQNIACRLYVPSNGKIFALGSYVIQCKIESN